MGSGLGLSRQTLDLSEVSSSYRGAADAVEGGVLWRASHLKALSSTIEGDIIPRLLLAHASGGVANRAPSTRGVSEADVTAFADLLLSRGPDRCIAFAERLVADGVALDALFLTLFAPTARILGVFWTEDLQSFTDVTIGLVGLQRVLRHFSSAFDEEALMPAPRQALLVPAPGEQHTFGLFMVEMFLRRDGWEVAALPVYDEREVRSILRSGPVDLVGVSCSCDRFIDAVGTTVGMVRGEVAHALPVIGGGQVFLEQPQLGDALGLDAVVIDAHAAVETAAKLVPLTERRRQLC